MSTFDKDTFLGLLQSKYIGRTLVYTDVTGSTMDDARRLAHQVNEHPHGTAIVSERQTKARGARDHTWDASNTGNVYASIILHLPPAFKTFEGRFDLEVASCLAVTQVAQQLGITNVTPKWPNDVWVRGHKLAGFLVEDGKFTIPGSINCLIVLGIGINVNADVRRSLELSSLATSIRCERGGSEVNREQFFADVCLALEHYIEQPREVNLALFRQKNIFQALGDILVTCPSEGRVIEGKFLDVCDNWEVRFSDKNNEQVFQGRSDYYTVRPKVSNKILVVFAETPSPLVGGATNSVRGDGDGGDSSAAGSEARRSCQGSAQNVRSLLQCVVDTSKHVVCLVPESFVANSEDWMQTCSLLVLPESVSTPAKLSPKIETFLRRGGRALASGAAAGYMARLLEISTEEIHHNSSEMSSETSLVEIVLNSLDVTHNPLQTGSKEDVGFRLLETALSPELDQGQERAATSCKEDYSVDDAILKDASDSLGLEERKIQSDTKQTIIVFPSSCRGYHFCIQSKDSSNIVPAMNRTTKIDAVYSSSQSLPDGLVAACSVKSSALSGSHVGLLGFELGVVYPPLSSVGVRSSCHDQKVHDDRFKRDLFIQTIVDSLLI